MPPFQKLLHFGPPLFYFLRLIYLVGILAKHHFLSPSSTMLGIFFKLYVFIFSILFFIKFIGVTLINKIIWVSSVDFYYT